MSYGVSAAYLDRVNDMALTGIPEQVRQELS
jgi:hypothetical protein